MHQLKLFCRIVIIQSLELLETLPLPELLEPLESLELLKSLELSEPLEPLDSEVIYARNYCTVLCIYCSYYIYMYNLYFVTCISRNS